MPFESNPGVEYATNRDISTGYNGSGALRKDYILADEGHKYLYSRTTRAEGNKIFQAIFDEEGMEVLDFLSKVPHVYSRSVVVPSLAITKQQNSAGCMLNHPLRGVWGLPKIPNENDYYDYMNKLGGEKSYQSGSIKVSPNEENYAVFYQYHDFNTRRVSYGAAKNQTFFSDCSQIKFDIESNHQHIFDYRNDEALGGNIDMSAVFFIDSALLDSGSTATVINYRASNYPFITKTLLVTKNALGVIGYEPLETTIREKDNYNVLNNLRIESFENGFVVAYRVLKLVKGGYSHKIKLQFWEEESGELNLVNSQEIIPADDEYAFVGEECRSAFDEDKPRKASRFDIDTNYNGNTALVFTNDPRSHPLLEHYIFNRNGDVIHRSRQKAYGLKYVESLNGHCDMDYLSSQSWDSYEMYPVVSINNSGRYSILTQRNYASRYGGVDSQKSHGKIVIRDYKY